MHLLWLFEFVFHYWTVFTPQFSYCKWPNGNYEMENVAVYFFSLQLLLIPLTLSLEKLKGQAGGQVRVSHIKYSCNLESVRSAHKVGEIKKQKHSTISESLAKGSVGQWHPKSAFEGRCLIPSYFNLTESNHGSPAGLCTSGWPAEARHI